jgi:hypothetical protein
MDNNILISSELVYISSSINDVIIQSAKNTNMSTAGSFTVNVGPQGSKNPINIYRLNSPNIELGYQSDPSLTLEAIPKSDQLISVLQQMLSIMNDITNNPDEKEAITGEINLLSSQLNKIKSTITKTY